MLLPVPFPYHTQYNSNGIKQKKSNKTYQKQKLHAIYTLAMKWISLDFKNAGVINQTSPVLWAVGRKTSVSLSPSLQVSLSEGNQRCPLQTDSDRILVTVPVRPPSTSPTGTFKSSARLCGSYSSTSKGSRPPSMASSRLLCT